MNGLGRKVALVTGAAGGGVGTATVHLLASQGCAVYVNGRSHESVDAICQSIRKAGGQAHPAVADITDSVAVAALFDRIWAQESAVDILVSNAAPSPQDKLLEEVLDSDWELSLSTILFGAFLCCRSVVGRMKQQNHGRIIFVSSSAASTGSWGRDVTYAAAKAGLHGLTKRLALELAAFRITVNCVSPSLIDTPRVRKDGRRNDQSLAAHAAQRVPLGRVGQPEDVAQLISFLSSDAGSYITGQIVTIDGGTSLGSAPRPARTSTNSDGGAPVAAAAS
jgi:3-oxoacyl-[acyl-carrier protein] reductase